jgi:hypothetical protein
MAITSVFFDGGPFFEGLRGQGFSVDLDFIGLARELAAGEGDSAIGTVFFYMAVYPEGPYPAKCANQHALFDRLSKQGIVVRHAVTELHGAIFIDRGVEAALATDLVEGAYNHSFDQAIVVSRRAVFRPAVEAAKRAGRQANSAFFRYTTDPADGLASVVAISQAITTPMIVRHTLSGPIPFGAVASKT